MFCGVMSRTIPDLIVTDLDMPHMSGVELISHVRDCRPSISIVAMSRRLQREAVAASITVHRFYSQGRIPTICSNHNRSLIATSQADRGVCDDRAC